MCGRYPGRSPAVNRSMKAPGRPNGIESLAGFGTGGPTACGGTAAPLTARSPEPAARKRRRGAVAVRWPAAGRFGDPGVQQEKNRTGQQFRSRCPAQKRRDRQRTDQRSQLADRSERRRPARSVPTRAISADRSEPCRTVPGRPMSAGQPESNHTEPARRTEPGRSAPNHALPSLSIRPSLSGPGRAHPNLLGNPSLPIRSIRPSIPPYVEPIRPLAAFLADAGLSVLPLQLASTATQAASGQHDASLTRFSRPG